MLFFLDVISPIPEFYIIEDNKVKFQRKILLREDDKLSDYIFETYLSMDKDLNLTKNLKKIAMINGPGSYTSLRVGASFLSGLKISKDLPFCQVSIGDFFKFKSKTNKIDNLAFYISSSKNQNFFCRLNKERKIQYYKLEEDNNNLESNISNIYYNHKQFKTNLKNINQYNFSFVDELLKNINKLHFTKSSIIKPIYISNNKILN